jgi:ribosomal-protein-alanine N-acetyltransferase
VIVLTLRAADEPGLAGLAAKESPGFDLGEERRRGESRVHVATAGPGLPAVAFSIERRVADEVELLALATEPTARRQGAARALLSDLLRRARDTGVTRVTLEVRSGNAAARALYAGLGFRQFHVRRGYYRASGEDALELERRLDGPGPE